MDSVPGSAGSTHLLLIHCQAKEAEDDLGVFPAMALFGFWLATSLRAEATCSPNKFFGPPAKAWRAGRREQFRTRLSQLLRLLRRGAPHNDGLSC